MTNWILGEKFDQTYDHIGSIKRLWEGKWKFPCSRSLYPFHDGRLEDFEPIFQQLIKDDVNDAYTDAYTEPFIPVAEALVANAAQIETTDPKQAIDLYKRACAVYRVSRFPFQCTPLKKKAYEAQKAAYMRGASLWDVPIQDIAIPHTHAAGEDGKEIPLYVRTPPDASKEKPCPVMLLITGLDGHRPDNTQRLDEFLARGWASVTCDIPGLADCPAARRDPKSPDRLFSAILDWMDTQPQFNMRKVVAWGLSAGGYYAIRLAHTHKDRVAGCVGQGAGTHHYLGREWLDKVDGHEYPFKLTPAMAMKYGYKDVEELKERAQKEFSLVDTGIVQMPSTRLLLVNGTLDGCMPIEDSMLLFEYGTWKEARFYKGLLHMGYPPANESVYPWLENVVATAG